MRNFTPGPWEVDGNTVYALESAGWHRGVERMQNRFSALVQSPRTSSSELEANARLIAAAPDLLEALEMARSELAGLPHSLGYEFTHIPKIDAAIAKALGAA